MRLPWKLRRSRGSSSYIGAAATVRAAQSAGVSVEEHVEDLWGQRGGTAAIVDRMQAAGALGPTDTVVEIGLAPAATSPVYARSSDRGDM